MDLLGALFSAGLASYLIYVRPSTAASVGFSLTMAIAFSSKQPLSGVILSDRCCVRHDPLVGAHWK